MKKDLERNMGEQPITAIMDELQLKPHDLVAASTEHITHKMVQRARKGRRLSRNVQFKIITALNTCAGKEYSLKELFNY